MLTSHDTMVGHFKLNFQLTFHHKYSLSDIENMLPWERFVYIDLIDASIREEAARKRDEMNAKRDLMKAANSLGKLNGRSNTNRI